MSTRVTKVLKLLQSSATSHFSRPACSKRLESNFKSTIENSLKNNKSQWIDDFIILRQLIDANQNILSQMNRLKPPKSEREVMELIGNRVGLPMTQNPNNQNDNSQNELNYYFEQIYVPYEKFNTDPSLDN